LLRDSDHAEVFILSMSIGFKDKRRTALEDAYPLINMNSLSEDQEWLIKALAISETGGVDILNQPRQIIKIAEEYANGGIDILYDRIYRGAGEYAKRLEEELRSIVKPGHPEQTPSQ